MIGRANAGTKLNRNKVTNGKLTNCDQNIPNINEKLTYSDQKLTKN